MSTVFKKIIDGEAPARIVYRDEQITAFWDIHRQAPVHILVVPNRVIPGANDLTPGDDALVGRMVRVAAQIAKEQGIAERGYRLMINCGSEGGQTVYHLHLHLLGGRPLGPMLAR
ncbi:MAG: histidine triad nucleotide-binding protein [Anaerolineae bacterium]|nr:histidine triad nucleotide-binding protein [Anaerolineae bacterium]